MAALASTHEESQQARPVRRYPSPIVCHKPLLMVRLLEALIGDRGPRATGGHPLSERVSPTVQLNKPDCLAHGMKESPVGEWARERCREDAAGREEVVQTRAEARHFTPSNDLQSNIFAIVAYWGAPHGWRRAGGGWAGESWEGNSLFG